MPWHPFLSGYELGEISELEELCLHIPRGLPEKEYTRLFTEKKIEMVCVWLKWSSHAPIMCSDCGKLACAMEIELLRLDKKFTEKYGECYFYMPNWKELPKSDTPHWNHERIFEFNRELMKTKPWQEWWQRKITLEILPNPWRNRVV